MLWKVYLLWPTILSLERRVDLVKKWPLLAISYGKRWPTCRLIGNQNVVAISISPIVTKSDSHKWLSLWWLASSLVAQCLIWQAYCDQTPLVAKNIWQPTWSYYWLPCWSQFTKFVVVCLMCVLGPANNLTLLRAACLMVELFKNDPFIYFFKLNMVKGKESSTKDWIYGFLVSEKSIKRELIISYENPTCKVIWASFMIVYLIWNLHLWLVTRADMWVGVWSIFHSSTLCGECQSWGKSFLGSSVM